MITWECEVPLLDRHQLTGEARDQLVKLVVGKPVVVGYPLPLERPPGQPRAEDPLGRVMSAWPLGGQVTLGGKAKLVLHLTDDDTGRVVVDMLRAGSCGVSLDMLVESPDARFWRDEEMPVTITLVQRVRSVQVVPLPSLGPFVEEASGG